MIPLLFSGTTVTLQSSCTVISIRGKICFVQVRHMCNSFRNNGRVYLHEFWQRTRGVWRDEYYVEIIRMWKCYRWRVHISITLRPTAPWSVRCAGVRNVTFDCTAADPVALLFVVPHAFTMGKHNFTCVRCNTLLTFIVCVFTGHSLVCAIELSRSIGLPVLLTQYMHIGNLALSYISHPDIH